MLVDEVVANFKAIQEESKMSYTSFLGIKARLPLIEVGEITMENVIADICKSDVSFCLAGLGMQQD
ncbi:hypothetical protein C2S51_009174 [Perilla frutescens var. frutescens]|nr:hypothetical protein C2S51_009174 [Perilla frutescens var. frutescens]